MSSAVDTRLAGKSAETAKTELAAPSSGLKGPIVDTVPPLVDMVYTIDKAGLTPQMVETFHEQYLKF